EEGMSGEDRGLRFFLRLSPQSSSLSPQAALATLPERRQRVQARMYLTVPFRLAFTRCRFGCQVRLVLLFAWLTLLPTEACLPRMPQAGAMGSPWDPMRATRWLAERQAVAARGGESRGFVARVAP